MCLARLLDPQLQCYTMPGLMLGLQILGHQGRQHVPDQSLRFTQRRPSEGQGLLQCPHILCLPGRQQV